MMDIASLYAHGLSCRDIAKMLGCNDETVRKRLIVLGIVRRPKSHKKPKPVPTWDEYFLDRIEVNGECLLWIGYRDDAGYGRCAAAFAPDITFTHRMSWFLKHGSFDLSLRVLHDCDTPPYVNPDHLWLGTQVENIADMVRKNRQQRGLGYGCGEAHPCARLSDKDVTEMRRLRNSVSAPYYKLAEQFGVSTMTALRACKGQSWSHLKEDANA